MYTDKFALAKLDEVIKKWGVKTIVETGTFEGKSTVEFSKRVESVVTIESNQAYFVNSKKILGDLENVRMEMGNSPKIIPNVLNHGERYLFYLDAHWYADWPLKEELRAIAKVYSEVALFHTPVIIIHDFQVPGKKFAFDTWKDPETQKECPLNWDYVGGEVMSICSTYQVSYNEEAEGHKVGICWCEPPEEGATEPELSS